MAEDRKILAVTDVRLAILESDPPKLKISASGTVGSTGWENAHLVPYRYFVTPLDGIWEFDFVAEDPSTELGIITTPTLTDIDAPPYIWDNYPETSVKGVRVYSSTNNVTKMLDDNFVMGGSNDVMTIKLLTLMGGSNSVMGGSNGVMSLTIYENCFGIYEGVVEICITVKTDEVCAEAKLLGFKLAESCLEYDVQENIGNVTFDFGTINSGVWRLENIIIKVEQNFDNGNGRASFTGQLYQLTLTSGYVKKREWNDEELGSW
jgi:hypothetical protein